MSAHGEFAQTEKQTEIIRLVLAAADAGEVMTYPLLQARLSYGAGVSPQSIQCSIRFLEKHGLVLRQKSLGDGRTTIIKPTSRTYRMFRPTPVSV